MYIFINVLLFDDGCLKFFSDDGVDYMYLSFVWAFYVGDTVLYLMNLGLSKICKLDPCKVKEDPKSDISMYVYTVIIFAICSMRTGKKWNFFYLCSKGEKLLEEGWKWFNLIYCRQREA